MDEMRTKLFPVFLQEAELNLAKLGEFLSCDKATGCTQELEAAFRAAHTLKGTALLVQAVSIHKIARRLEALLEKHYLAKTSLTRVEREALQLAVDWLDPLIKALQGNLQEPKQFVVEALQALDLAERFPGKTPLVELLDSHLQQRAPELDDPFADDPELPIDESEILRLSADPFADDPGFGMESHQVSLKPSSPASDEKIVPDNDDLSWTNEVADDEKYLGASPVERTDLPPDPFTEDPSNGDWDLPPAEPTEVPIQADTQVAAAKENDRLDLTAQGSDIAQDIGDVDKDIPEDPFAEDAVFFDNFSERGSAPEAVITELPETAPEAENSMTVAVAQADSIAASLLLPEAEATPRQEYRCCSFQVSGREYFLPIEQMLEISDLFEILPLPLAPTMVRGLINLRGQVIPVIDMAALNDHQDPASTLVQRLVVAEHHGEQLAFLADGVPYLSEEFNGERIDLPKFLSLYRVRGEEE